MVLEFCIKFLVNPCVVGIKTVLSFLLDFNLQQHVYALSSFLLVCFFVCFLFALWFNGQVVNFSVMLEWSHRFLGIHRYYGAVEGCEPSTS